MRRIIKTPAYKAHVIVVYRDGQDEHNLPKFRAETVFYGCALRGGKEFMKALQKAQQDPEATSVNYSEGREEVSIRLVH